MRPRCVVARAAVLLFCATIPATAQESLRLSSPEGTTRSLPTEMRVQAAARIGERSLVCWGTVEIDAAGVARNVLRVQTGRNGGPVDGTPARLHSESARPSGVLHVAAAVDHFVVFWGDVRRSAPGLFARSFDLDGVPIGPERLLAAGEITELLSYRWIGEMVVVRADSSALFLRNDGTVEPAAPSPRRFLLPHVLRADSSLVVLDGHRLDLYRHFIDPSPSLSRDVAVEDTSFVDAWTLSDVGLDAVAVTAVVRNRRPDCMGLGEAVILRQIRFDDELVVTGTADVDSLADCTFETTVPRIRDVRRERVDGGFRIGVVFFQNPNITRSYFFTVSACGAVERSARASVTCRPGEEIIVRTSSDSVSAVSLGAGTFSTPIHARDSGLHDDTPNVLARRGGVLVTWTRRAEPPEPFGSMSAHVARWSGRERVDLGTVDGEYGQWETSNSNQTTSVDARAWPLARHGATAVGWTGFTDVLWGNDVGSFAIDVATASGWTRVDGDSRNFARFDRPVMATDPNDTTAVVSIGAPEGERGTIVAADGSIVRRFRLPEGHPEHLVPISRSEWIAAGVGAAPTELVRMNDTMVLARAARPSDGALEEIWQRELGSTFVRASLTRDDRSLLVERFNVDLAIVDSVRVRLAPDARDLSIVLNRADSSLGFLYVSGWDVRMAMLAHDLDVRSSDYLVYAGEDSLRHPAGVIEGRTLHAVWQDFRNRDADVYGRSVEGPFSGVETRESGDAVFRAPTITAAPVPASGAVSIIVVGATSDARLSVVDVQGRAIVVATLPAGSSRVSLDSSTLPSGLYVARIVDRRGVASCEIVIAR